MHPVDRDSLLNYYAGDLDRFRSVPMQVVEDELWKDHARWVANQQPENEPDWDVNRPPESEERFKSFRGAQPPRKLRWTNAGC
jgi:hypothetical protein